MKETAVALLCQQVLLFHHLWKDVPDLSRERPYFLFKRFALILNLQQKK